MLFRSCPGAAVRQPLTPQGDMRAAEKAFAMARRKMGNDCRLMVRAARERLERLHERFIAPEQADVRAALLDASRALETWADIAGKTEPEEDADVLSKLKEARRLVTRDEKRSLYEPAVLRAELERAGLLVR